ncbi:ATP-binding protein [Azospira restricta]|uniref:histidine kinase n=1 Tax=Azospira restricta TaxID=404405 RepID=A0A974PWF7_9RHOO|nr:ATP-binding protein [Azospira restricta]QRJ62727.1 PAS domain S-box protein [Azospira restricta]
MDFPHLIPVAAGGYLLFIFAVAGLAEASARRGRSLIANPVAYALSLAVVYASALLFYGGVGGAVKSGAAVIPLYLGPALIAAAWWFLQRKVVHIAQKYRITSIGDFLTVRYGGGIGFAALVSLVALIGTIPLFALQLKAVASSIAVLQQYPLVVMPAFASSRPILSDPTFYTTVVLAVFTIVFGIRHLDASERHEGVVAVVALQSAIVLVAALAAGIFVTFFMYDGFRDLFDRAEQPSLISLAAGEIPRWNTLMLLSIGALLLAPRQFQIAAVENVDERHLRASSTLFPLYLLLLAIFVLPVTFAGLAKLPGGAIDPDMFLLALPVTEGATTVALLVFLGGLSAATAMIVVEAIALSTMCCNGVAMPLLLRSRRLAGAGHETFTALLLAIRRGVALLLLVLGYLYYRYAGEVTSMLATGSISLVAIAQLGPAFVGALFWPQGSRKGVLAGMLAGFAVWCYTLLLPSLGHSGWDAAAAMVATGPFGIDWLRPTQLFGAGNLDLVSHGAYTSLIANLVVYVTVSLLSRQSVEEEIQAARFCDPFGGESAVRAERLLRGKISRERLETMLARFLGPAQARDALAAYGRARGWRSALEIRLDADVVSHCESLLAGRIGNLAARLTVDAAISRTELDMREMLDILDEVSDTISYSNELARKQKELEEKSAQLMASEQRFRDLAESASDWFWETDEALRLVYVSERFYAASGLRPNDVLGKRRWEIERRDSADQTLAERWQRHIEQLQAHQPFRNFVYELATPGGSISVSVSGTPFFDEEGCFRGYRGTGTDVSPLINAQVLLARSEKSSALGYLVAGVAHELNTPIGNGLIAASTLIDETRSFEASIAGGLRRSALEKHVATARNAGEILMRCLNRVAELIRSFKRVAEYGETLERREFRLLPVVERVVAMLAPSSHRASVTVSVDVPADLMLASYPTLIEDILAKLIRNALLHAFDGREAGRVWVVGREREGGLVSLLVADDGIGIPSAHLGRIFDPFFTTKLGSGESGLGLCIVSNVVENVLGGRIEVRSDPARGSEFEARFPRISPPTADAGEG